MPRRFEPKTAILPPAQWEIWPQLAPAAELSFVLYGGTAVALHLGHRQSLDFDLFSAEPLDKTLLESSFAFMRDAQTIQEEPQTLVYRPRPRSIQCGFRFSARSDSDTSTRPCKQPTKCFWSRPSKI
jgi:hypothetical protein